MGFWQTLVGWLLDEDDTSSTGGVAVLEPEADAPGGLSADEEESVLSWWQPDGNLMTAPPKADRPDGSDTQEDAVLAQLEQKLGDADIELPHLPQVPQQILNLIRQDNVTMPQIAGLISQDQVLSAAVLRRVNSVAMRGMSEITDLAAAVARLGIRGIRTCMISHSVRNLTISVGAGQSRGQNLWRQSLAAGIIAAKYEECFNVCREDAFLLGLLHDIGSVVVLLAAHEAESASRTPISDATFDYLCQEYHELMGEMLAERWRLPEEISSIITNHQSSLQSHDPFLEARALIQLTEATVSLLGYSQPYPIDLLDTSAAHQLNAADNETFVNLLPKLPEAVEQGINTS